MEQLKNNIKIKLEQSGFKFNSGIWDKTTKQTFAGSTIIINGKQKQQPGETVNVQMIIEDLGDCVVTDIATNTEILSNLYGFKLLHNSKIAQEYIINLYSEDYKMFNDILNKMFKL